VGYENIFSSFKLDALLFSFSRSPKFTAVRSFQILWASIAASMSTGKLAGIWSRR
jgi:hypothetical protein